MMEDKEESTPVLDDKAIGELWRRTLLHLTWPEPEDVGRLFAVEYDVIALIRKLVGERVRVYQRDHIMEYRGDDYQADVLRDFGIDPATWDATKMPQNRKD